MTRLLPSSSAGGGRDSAVPSRCHGSPEECCTRLSGSLPAVGGVVLARWVTSSGAEHPLHHTEWSGEVSTCGVLEFFQSGLNGCLFFSGKD